MFLTSRQGKAILRKNKLEHKILRTNIDIPEMDSYSELIAAYEETYSGFGSPQLPAFLYGPANRKEFLSEIHDVPDGVWSVQPEGFIFSGPQGLLEELTFISDLRARLSLLTLSQQQNRSLTLRSRTCPFKNQKQQNHLQNSPNNRDTYQRIETSSSAIKKTVILFPSQKLMYV